MKPHFQVFDTTGDVGINVFGNNLKEIFEQAAIGLFSFFTDLESIEENIIKTVSIDAESYENLLIKWLNELIFLFDVEGFIGKRVKINNLNEKSLTAKIMGDLFDEKKHSQGILIKAATYHKLKLEKKNKVWSASILFDI
ncbi:MAG: archease [Proteobacteria bacterium]|nr:archease [Pseudomonadota bacterium]